MTYSPNLGRWLEKDPIGYEAGDNNLYRYVGNSPVNYTDPSGLYRSATGRYICIHELELPSPDEYLDIPGGRNRGIRLNGWTFTNVTFDWRRARYRGDIEVDTYGERRFKSTVEFGDDRVLTNFATYIRIEYSFSNLHRIEGNKEVKVPDFKEDYWLPVRLIGVFIAPTIDQFASKFKPTSFATFEREFIEGLRKLPMGHPSDKPK